MPLSRTKYGNSSFLHVSVRKLPLFDAWRILYWRSLSRTIKRHNRRLGMYHNYILDHGNSGQRLLAASSDRDTKSKRYCDVRHNHWLMGNSRPMYKRNVWQCKEAKWVRWSLWWTSYFESFDNTDSWLLFSIDTFVPHCKSGQGANGSNGTERQQNESIILVNIASMFPDAAPVLQYNGTSLLQIKIQSI